MGLSDVGGVSSFAFGVRGLRNELPLAVADKTPTVGAVFLQNSGL